MGLCLPCLGGAAADVVETPDPGLAQVLLYVCGENEKRMMIPVNRIPRITNPLVCKDSHLCSALARLDGQATEYEVKRRQLAEAAEKRQMEASSRGIKNPSSVEQKKRKQEEMEKRLESATPGPEGGGLRWQVG
uniref:Uncharacterized protein n=1 Tax=Sphaerodactylus townsendi TaxID=933632 RepID=A0ACB8G3I7_9SAUR